MNNKNTIILSYNEYTLIGAGAKAPSDISNILKNKGKKPYINFNVPKFKNLVDCIIEVKEPQFGVN